MTKQQKLTKLIEIAIENGLKTPFLEKEVLTINCGRQFGKNHSLTLWRNGLLLSHDFAKAIWGEEDGTGLEGVNFPKWQMHLQQAVISDDPLEYYWKNKP